MSGAGGKDEMDIRYKMDVGNIVVLGRNDFYLQGIDYPPGGVVESDDFKAGLMAACRFFVPYIVDTRRDAIVAKNGALGSDWATRTKIAQNGAGFIERTNRFVKMDF